MKKLSELSNDTLLCVCNEHSDAEDVMEKVDFLKDVRRSQLHRVSMADELTERFAWMSAIEALEEDMHEDWTERVMDDIRAMPELVKAEKLVNEILRKNPTYYSGESVENDMMGDKS